MNLILLRILNCFFWSFLFRQLVHVLSIYCENSISLWQLVGLFALTQVTCWNRFQGYSTAPPFQFFWNRRIISRTLSLFFEMFSSSIFLRSMFVHLWCWIFVSEHTHCKRPSSSQMHVGFLFRTQSQPWVGWLYFETDGFGSSCWIVMDPLQQKKQGTTIGSNFAICYACLFLCFLEKHLFENFDI